MDCDSSLLIIKKKRDSKDTLQKMELTKICLSKNYKQYKSKWIFSLYYETVKQVFGFDQEITC
jgi:hypothetical protein